MSQKDLNIAVLLPCPRNAASLTKSVFDFRRIVPGARVFVYHYGDVPHLAEQAARAGATVVPALGRKPISVVHQMISDIDADLYFLATDPQNASINLAPDMITKLIEERLDMAVQAPPSSSKREQEHGSLVNSPFHLMTRRFAQSFRAEYSKRPVSEALLIHALSLDVGIGGISSDSMKPVSKFSLLKTKIKTVRVLQPIKFYGAFVLAFMASALGLAILAATQYALNSLTVPTLIWLGLSLTMAASLLALTIAIILQANTLSRIEQKRIYYHSMEPSRGEKLLVAPTLVIERRGRKAIAMGTQYRNVRAH